MSRLDFAAKTFFVLKQSLSFSFQAKKMIQTSTLQFLNHLKQNNSKPWFDAHRTIYEAAKEDFLGFISRVIQKLSTTETALADLNAKDCIFRINRDVRFTKNKSPYKTNFGASIKLGGKKSDFAGFYFHLEPGESFVGGGLWMPRAEQLAKLRQEIDYNFSDFKKIISSKAFTSCYGSLVSDPAQSLKRVPKGYEANHPAANYLKMKSFIAQISLTDKELKNPGLLPKVLHAFLVLKPLIDFLNVPLMEE